MLSKFSVIGLAVVLLGATGCGRDHALESSHAFARLETAGDVVSQSEIGHRVERYQPMHRAFIKDAPILGYRLTADSLAELPPVIASALGSVDQTKYTPEYLEKNRGTLIALQADGDRPDFYIIGLETLRAKYREVAVSEVATKNAKLLAKLEKIAGMKELLASGDANLVGALKTAPVAMLVMSSLGFPVAEEVTIESPWGEQTKPAGRDAYLVYDSGKSMYYMVNAGDDGLPLSYVPAE